MTSLITELCEVTHRRGAKFFCSGPVFVRPAALGWVEGLDPAAIGRVVDRYGVALYFEDHDQRASEAFSAVGLHLDCELGASVNVGHPYTLDCEDLAATARLAKRAGFASVGFYNYGMLPEYRLAWIRDVISLLKHE